MKNTNEANFQLMRFNILSTSLANQESSPFSSAYIYAWDAGVYPLFNDGADWHKPFNAQFKVTESEIDELSKLLDENWLAKKPITFYELEDHFDVKGTSYTNSNWERWKLITACRYMYLQELFDTDFWASLVENGKCPSEALSICRPFKLTDIYFM
ncbi:hypothetical protein [Pseudomonas sp.]|uniref:hypothetical protein n=1 Tax=Pseudomonas sp. TaxID=306 RepID=UPI00299ECB2E|nr:hypothetical protein [Pseudomonas sp.]MDX1366807.1 hypothetical protein [Pseudomonas sp.]